MSGLGDIRRDWIACDRCELSKFRKNVVFGSVWKTEAGGPLVLAIGEAPGRNEDETGEAFVGKAGEILRKEILVPAGVGLAFIATCLSCRPPGNRDPETAEIEACAPRIRALVETLNPDGVLTIGKFAEEAIVSGVWGEAIAALPRAAILHPAALLRRGYPNDATRKALNVQIAKVKRLLFRLGLRTGEKLPDPVADNAGDPGECDHRDVPVGVWETKRGTRVRMLACVKCARLSDSATGGA